MLDIAFDFTVSISIFLRCECELRSPSPVCQYPDTPSSKLVERWFRAAEFGPRRPYHQVFSFTEGIPSIECMILLVGVFVSRYINVVHTDSDEFMNNWQVEVNP